MHEHNWHHPALDPLVAEVRADAALRREVGVLKHRVPDRTPRRSSTATSTPGR